MKKLLLLVTLIAIALSKSFASTSVIMGVEDTFKRTRGESVRAFYNSLLSQKVYAGMDSWAKEIKGDLYLVSEQYNFLRFTSEKLVEEFDLAPKEIVSREPFRYDSEFAYKYAVYKRIIEASEDDFVLVGNDKGVDQEVFQQILKEFPDRVLDVYIRVVKNNEPAKGMISFHTAFDIAAKEFGKGRLAYSQVKRVGESIFSEEKFHKVFPANGHCPTETAEIKTQNPKTLERIASEIRKKTLEYCNG